MATTITDRRRSAAVAVLALFAFGCGAQNDDDDASPTPADVDLPAGASLSAEIVCADPVSGADRFTEEGAARGLTREIEDIQYGPVYFLAVDLDADGDVDIVHSTREERRPLPFLNDGEGSFTPTERLPYGGAGPSSGAMAAADVDDDGLPEIFLVGSPTLYLYPNLGGGLFGEPSTLYQEQPPDAYRYPALSVADADGDGDIDVALFRHEPQQPPPGGERGEPQPFEGTDDLLLTLEDGVVDGILTLPSAGGGTLGLAGTFTDRDGDGDQDLLIPSDRDLPIAFWRNDGVEEDGLPAMVDDAADIGAAVLMDGMGLDSADLNGDGLLDYCITDTGNTVCLVGEDDLYSDRSLAMGLTPDAPPAPISTIGWSFDFADYDNDGAIDGAQVTGPMFDAAVTEWPDLIWFGDGDGGFEDRSADIGFDTVEDNYALASADFDGDGYLDILRGSPGSTPSLWMNRCGDGGWLEVDLRGPDGNRTALGAQVEVTYGDRTMLREVNGPRGNAQTPPVLHFGTGEVDVVESVRILWPDGTTVETADVPVRRRLTVPHPDAG